LKALGQLILNKNKMTTKILLALLAGFILLTSCNKEDEIKLSDGDYLIFGHFYGECFGEECVEIFRLENNRLLEDNKDTYPGQSAFYEGNYHELNHEKFEKVKDLIDFFPEGLLNENDKVIGQPDAGDWGGLYIEYNYKGLRKFWLLDQMESNVPGYLHEFIDKVNEKIKLINDKK
jgi:hypothetical protein